MTYVINRNGTQVNYDVAVSLMDDGLREALHAEGYHTPQEFFAAYEAAHEEKFGELWELSKDNPVY